MSGLAIDFASQVAYVGSSSTDNLYVVNIARTRQSMSAYHAYLLNTGVVSLAISQDGLTLYYASPAPVYEVPGTINELQVQAGSVHTPATPLWCTACRTRDT